MSNTSESANLLSYDTFMLYMQNQTILTLEETLHLLISKFLLTNDFKKLRKKIIKENWRNCPYGGNAPPYLISASSGRQKENPIKAWALHTPTPFFPHYALLHQKY